MGCCHELRRIPTEPVSEQMLPQASTWPVTFFLLTADTDLAGLAPTLTEAGGLYCGDVVCVGQCTQHPRNHTLSTMNLLRSCSHLREASRLPRIG